MSEGQGAGNSVVRVQAVTKQYRKAAHAHRFLTLKSAILGGDLQRRDPVHVLAVDVGFPLGVGD